MPTMAARILPLLLSAAAQDTVSVLLDINGAKQPLVIPTRGAVDATVAGLLLVPMMGTMLVTSVIAGRAVTRTGKYKRLLIVGTAG